MSQASDAHWRESYENAWAGLRMIRETVETLGPPGALPSEEAVLGLYGPEPIREATAIVEARRRSYIQTRARIISRGNTAPSRIALTSAVARA